MTGESCRHALAAADKHEEIFVSVGRHPHESEGLDEAGLAELRELSGHPKARAIGEAGLDYKRDYAPREDQRALLRGPDRAGARARTAAGGAHARGGRRHARPARPPRRRRAR